ncbi:TrbC/VirB2 family protein [Enterococcus faecium]|nr:hypothetical protein [Enterococcus faecium]
MLNELTKQVLFNPKVVAAVDVFNAIQKAGQDFKGKLMIVAAIIAVVSVIVGGLMFLFGRKGAENGKSHIFNVIVGVIIVLAATSLIASAFGLFGQTPQGI